MKTIYHGMHYPYRLICCCGLYFFSVYLWECLIKFSAPDKKVNRDNLGIISQISPYLHGNIFCDPSLEPSRLDGSNEGSQHMFSLRNR